MGLGGARPSCQWLQTWSHPREHPWMTLMGRVLHPSARLGTVYEQVPVAALCWATAESPPADQVRGGKPSHGVRHKPVQILTLGHLRQVPCLLWASVSSSMKWEPRAGTCPPCHARVPRPSPLPQVWSNAERQWWRWWRGGPQPPRSFPGSVLPV